LSPTASSEDGIRRVFTDNSWRELAHVLNRVLSKRGAPAALDVREFVEAVLFLARTGTPWRDLPSCFGNWDAVYQRFRRWEKKGKWSAIWRELQAPAVADAKSLFIDSTIVRAHQHASGGSGSAAEKAVGKSRGGLGTKIHLIATDERTALAAVLTGGQAGDAPAFDVAMREVPEETAATAIVADRAYDSDEIRKDLADAGFEIVIPTKRNRKEPIPHNKEKYKTREKAERLVNRLKRLRRVATRYEKLGSVFLAMVHIACIASILL
jgi:transposase